MDSSDVTPSRLFSSGEAHGLPQNGDSALIERRYRTSFGGYVIARWCFVIPSSFVIRDSSFIAVGAENSATRLRPRIARNAELFSVFQDTPVHQIAIVLGPTGRG